MTPPKPVGRTLGAKADAHALRCVLPDDLLSRRQWVVWRYELRQGRGGEPKWTKPPYSALTGKNASSTDPLTWASFEEVLRRYNADRRLEGIGFVVTPDDPLVGGDIDHCVDDGVIQPWARKVLSAMDTFAERSPNDGARFIARGQLPQGAGNKKPATILGGGAGTAIELYDRARYFTITGRHIEGMPLSIEERQTELQALHACVWPPAEKPANNGHKPAVSLTLADDEIIAKCRRADNSAKFERLYGLGSAGEYASPSEADFALAGILKFWTQDSAQLERLMRASALYRDKWDERHGGGTYLQQTISRALASVGETYSGRGPASRNGASRPTHASPETDVAAEDVAPEPLDDVPPFPMDVLPREFRRFAEESREALSIFPPDYVPFFLLGAVGAATGNAMVLEIKDGHIVFANDYSGAIGMPGTGKTPALDAALEPILLIQQVLNADFEARQDQYDKDLALWEKGEARTRGPRPRVPAYESLYTTDATTEQLAVMLRDSKGLLYRKDELVGWAKSMDAYRPQGKGGDRQFFLSAYNCQPLKVDRKGKDGHVAPILVPRPCLSVVGSIQPDVLPLLADITKQNDGFTDRLTLIWPDDPEQNDYSWVCITPEARDGLLSAFKRLWSLKGVNADEGGGLEPRRVRLCEDARRLWGEWWRENRKEMTHPLFPSYLKGRWSKLDSVLGRNALKLHAMENPEAPELSERTLAAACDYVDYLKPHARRVYRYLHSQGEKDGAVKALRAVKEAGEILHTSLCRAVFKSNTSSQVIKGWLEQYETDGFIRRENRKPETGRPGLWWVWVR